MNFHPKIYSTLVLWRLFLKLNQKKKKKKNIREKSNLAKLPTGYLASMNMHVIMYNVPNLHTIKVNALICIGNLSEEKQIFYCFSDKPYIFGTGKCCSFLNRRSRERI